MGVRLTRVQVLTALGEMESELPGHVVTCLFASEEATQLFPEWLPHFTSPP